MEDYEIRKTQGLKSNDGNTIAVVLPKKMCEKLGIGKGDYMKVSLDSDKKQIIVEKPEN